MNKKVQKKLSTILQLLLITIKKAVRDEPEQPYIFMEVSITNQYHYHHRKKHQRQQLKRQGRCFQQV